MIDKLNKNFFLIFSCIGLAAGICIWFLPWRFQVNDDQIMMWLVSGAYTGTLESYAVFIHPMLSWIFSKLYTFYPSIPWYPLCWFLMIFLSYIAYLSVLAKRTKRFHYKHLIALLNFSIFLHFLFFVQFTLVAAYVAMAGYSLLFCNPKTLSKKAIFFLALGCLIRWEAVMLVSIGVFLYYGIARSSGQWKSLANKLAAMVFIAGLIFWSKSYWEQNSSYVEFLEFNKARSGVIDHPVFYRQVVQNDIKEDSPWFFFSRWFFEKGEIDLNQLKRKKAELNKELVSFKQLKSTFSRIYTVQKAEAYKSFLAILIVTIFFWSSDKKGRIFLATWLLLFLILNHFLLFYGRVTILFFLVLLIPLSSENAFWNKKTYSIIIAGIVIFGMVFHTSNFLKEGRGREIMRTEMSSLIEEVPAGEAIFLEGYQEHMFGLDYTANKPVPFINQGWLSRSPFQQKALKRFNVNDFSELDSYALLAIMMEEKLVFPDYMKKLDPRFKEVYRKQSPNFELIRFRIED